MLIIIGLCFLAPFAWMINASLKEEGHALNTQIEPALNPQWSNYAKALDKMGNKETGGFPRIVLNTVIITVLSIIFQVITCSLAGYAFARLRFKGRDLLFVLVLATMMLPMHVTVIPQFMIFQTLGWIDTFLPLVVPCLLGGSPFFIFLFRQYFLTIPKDVIESARMDGCSWWSIYRNIMMPLAKPIIATVAIFTFLHVWNDLWLPLIYLNSRENMTLTLALTEFTRQFRTEVEPLMAASTIVLMPCLLVYFFTQKYFIKGIQLTATKG